MNWRIWTVSLVIGICLGLQSIEYAEAEEQFIPLEIKKPKRIRALHFVLRQVSFDRACWIVDLAQQAGFNTILVQLTDGIQLDHAPWKPLPSAWNKDVFKKWLDYVHTKGMTVLPEIKLLTHQEKLFQRKFPHLMFNSATYDPDKTDVINRIYLLLEEVIELTQSKAIHIGHDEVAGHNMSSRKKWLRNGERMLPAELFLRNVKMVHKYLKQKGIETWMWGDMLISPNEFPIMLPRNLFGSAAGYGKALRNQLPRSIVICDWHYLDDQAEFPSLSTMQKEGFRVVGSTWEKEKTIRNFSQYATKHNAYGMIATTWSYVQRKQWNIVNRIINVSGEIFNKDFPDAK